MILIDCEMPKSCLGSIQCPYAGFMCDGYSNYKGDIMDLYSKRADNCPIIAEIPDNPTNGDVIKALFPSIEVCDNSINEKVYTGIPHNELIGVNIDATHEWWDAPYKGVEK